MKRSRFVNAFIYSHTALFPCGCRLRIEADEDPGSPLVQIYPCGPLDCPTLQVLRLIRVDTLTCDGHERLTPALHGAD